MHQRERLCALEPRDSGILLTTLRSYDEIRDAAAVFGQHLPKPDRQMLEIAEKIVEQQKARFDPKKFEDRYEDALRELIARKKKGEKLVSSAEPVEDDKVVDLMEALSQSLKGRGAIPRDKAERFAATRRRAGSNRRKKRRASSRAA
jgi:DNA end-binding protein Ku